MKKKIVLIGGGGHCKVVIDAIFRMGEYKIEGIVDPILKIGDKISNVPVIGRDHILPSMFKKGVKSAFICVGSIGDCILRKRLYKKIKYIGFNLPIIVHPKAVTAHDIEIKEGSFIAASATVNPGTTIGKNVIINTSASIDHDCQIGDFVHIAPGVTLSGGVKVKDEAHIGTGATVIQYLSIGRKSFIAAGATVTKNVGDNERYYGYYHKEENGE